VPSIGTRTSRGTSPRARSAVTAGQDGADAGPAVPRHYFGQPSDYSLSVAELARHIRRLRAAGWMAWECEARFGRAA
jgi:hypothetical protein